jgi:hypothetical protein
MWHKESKYAKYRHCDFIWLCFYFLVFKTGTVLSIFILKSKNKKVRTGVFFVKSVVHNITS